MSPSPPSATNSRLPLACLIAALVVAALPAVLTPMPPLLDYPNHLVRFWLLGGAIDRGPMGAYYAIDWGKAWTNVGLDAIAQAVGWLVPAKVLSAAFLTLAIVLPPLGAALLHRLLFGGWRPWQVAMAIAGYSTTLLAGFLNYHVGLGLALMAVAADPWLARTGSPFRLVMARIAIATLLLVAHIFAVGFYAVLLAGMALGPRLAFLTDFTELKRTVWRLVLAGIGPATPLLAYALTAPNKPGGGDWGPIWGPTRLGYKLEVLHCAIGTYDVKIDLAPLLVLALTAIVALFRRRLQAHLGLVLAALGLAVLSLIAPTWAADTGFVDQRLPIMALLALMAALNPVVRSPRAVGVLALAALGLVAARTAWIGHIWELRQADQRALERAMAHIPRGAAVMPVEHRPSRPAIMTAPEGRYFHMGASYYHMYNLVEIERDAFAPLVFAAEGKQPLRVKPPYDRVAAVNGGRAPGFINLRRPHRSWLEIAPYMRDWRNDFDYALMLNADLAPRVGEPPEGMTLVTNEGFARVYKITPGRTSTP